MISVLKQIMLITGFIFLVWLTAVGSVCVATPHRHELQGTFRYLNAERTTFFVVSGGYSRVGPILPKRPSREVTNIFSDEILGTFADDCSNSDYHCVRTGHYVFSVPEKGLEPYLKYTFGGTNFAVLSCIRNSGSRCQVAVIEADCQQVALPEGCKTVPGGRARAPNPGPIAYLIFNEDFGITSFGFAEEATSNHTLIERISREYSLQGDVGLLKPR